MREPLELVANSKLKPPVALLIYHAEQPQKASFYPFASFSPEWQTVSYCLKNLVELRCFDLPAENWLALGAADEAGSETADEANEDLQQQRQLIGDPLGYIGRLAGYEDGERWWEEVMEKQTNDEQLFEGILTLMTALRGELSIAESPETQYREAKMRQALRDAEKDGFERVAVVCGAWHTPALAAYPTSEKDDQKLLKKLKKVAVKHTWVPWTYERLSTYSGYGAGIVSPAWYEMLFKVKREKVLTTWMTRAARLLREQDMDTSSAHVIEATRLAHTLAALREMHTPGLTEMSEAVTTIFGGGYPEVLKLIEKELIVGSQMGEIPKDIKTSPLQDDFEKQRKKMRLKLEETKKTHEWDLREKNDLEKSRFLHRLNLLNIRWGTVSTYKQGRQRVSSKETWSLKWKPEMAIAIVEAGVWGNTVVEAATNFSAYQIQHKNDLPTLTKLLKDCLNADLSIILPALVQKLSNLAAVSHDVLELIEALPNFVEVARYTATDVRGTDTQAIEQMLNQIIPRIFIALPNLCASLDMDAANDMWNRIQKTHQSILLYNNAAFIADWYQTLVRISQLPNVDGKIVGGCNRVLSDAQKFDTAQLQAALSQALSQGQEAMYSVRWLDGFLMDNVMILLYSPGIVKLITDWLAALDEPQFHAYVALMRKVFSRFSIPERQKIFQLILKLQREPESPFSPKGGTTALNPQRAELIAASLDRLLEKVYGTN